MGVPKLYNYSAPPALPRFMPNSPRKNSSLDSKPAEPLDEVEINGTIPLHPEVEPFREAMAQHGVPADGVMLYFYNLGYEWRQTLKKPASIHQAMTEHFATLMQDEKALNEVAEGITEEMSLPEALKSVAETVKWGYPEASKYLNKAMCLIDKETLEREHFLEALEKETKEFSPKAQPGYIVLKGYKDGKKAKANTFSDDFSGEKITYKIKARVS